MAEPDNGRSDLVSTGNSTSRETVGETDESGHPDHVGRVCAACCRRCVRSRPCNSRVLSLVGIAGSGHTDDVPAVLAISVCAAVRLAAQRGPECKPSSWTRLLPEAIDHAQGPCQRRILGGGSAWWTRYDSYG